VFLLTGTASIEKFYLFLINKTHTLIVMAFKKYSIKSHYKVNKLVRIIKFSHFKHLSDNLNMNKTTKVFSKLDVILNSKRHNLGLLKHS
jgi:hypothetical protein